MSDIVERLRKGTITQPGNQHPTCDDVDAADALMAKAADEITRLRTALSEAEQRARREALEEAAKTIEEGFDRGIASKHDMCIHKKFEWEDCESCAANAVRALIPSEPHDAEGRDVTSQR